MEVGREQQKIVIGRKNTVGQEEAGVLHLTTGSASTPQATLTALYREVEMERRGQQKQLLKVRFCYSNVNWMCLSQWP